MGGGGNGCDSGLLGDVTTMCVYVCVCVCVCDVCVQCMYDSRTLDLAVGMPLQVETLQKEVQHLKKASTLHSHTKPLHIQCKYDCFEYQSSWTATCNFNKFA